MVDPATGAMIINAVAQIGSKLFGGGDKIKKLDNYTPEQQSFFKNYTNMAQQLQGGQGGIQSVLGLLQQYLNPESDAYKNFEAPYLQKFNTQTIPGIAERFAGANAMGGGLMSSGFGQALGGASADYASNLAGLKSQLQRGSIQDLLGLFTNMGQNVLGAQPFSYLHKPGESNPMTNFASGMNQGLFQNGGWGGGQGGGQAPFSSIMNLFGGGGGGNDISAGGFSRQSGF